MDSRYVMVSRDPDVVQAAKDAFERFGKLEVFGTWQEGLAAAPGAELMFVDQMATLEDAHKVAGYEKFAEAKMADAKAKNVKLVLITPEESYELDFVVGYPDFLFAKLPRPVTSKMLLRMSTYV